MRVFELLQTSINALCDAGIGSSSIDAELLLGFCLGCSRTELYLRYNELLSQAVIEQFTLLLKRRLSREPLAYIIGTQEFWSLDFLVTPDVLIPRPETEQLLERVIAQNSKKDFATGLLVDLCCGSGVIAVVLAKELRRQVLAIDISAEALEITKKNCQKHGVADLVFLLRADLLSGIGRNNSISCVVSNPPYVSSFEMDAGLQPEVALFEPPIALDGGIHGVESISRIRSQLQGRLQPGGHLFMEIGAEQKERVRKIFSENNEMEQSFSKISVHKDYAGHDRILYAQAANS